MPLKKERAACHINGWEPSAEKICNDFLPERFTSHIHFPAFFFLRGTVPVLSPTASFPDKQGKGGSQDRKKITGSCTCYP